MTLKYAGWRLEGNSHFLWVGEVLFSLAWQSPRDGVSVPYNLVFSFNVDPGFFLHDIGEICTMLTWHLQQPVIIKKLTGPKKKINESDVLQTTMHWIFPVQCCMGALGKYCTRFLPMQWCSETITNIKQNFLMYNFVWSHLDNIPQDIFPVQCCLKSIETTLSTHHHPKATTLATAHFYLPISNSCF